MAQPDAGRNLLFGLLAFRNDLIDREALLGAFAAWVEDKSRPIGDLLVQRGALAAPLREALEVMAEAHVGGHDGDPEKSLAALSGGAGSTREALESIADPELQASLGHVPQTSRTVDADPYATRASAVGAPTSTGGRFKILRFHAKGGLGQVSVAMDEELHREVALKEIQGHHADVPASRGRFVLEAEVTGGLEHPGIVPVYGLGHDPYTGRPYYAMRFIKGDDLGTAIDRFHQSEESRADRYENSVAFRELLGRFLDVCNAVAYAHARRVLHRDLKPGNIMLGPYGETLVVDWGLAKVMGRPGEARTRAAAEGETEEAPLTPASGSSIEPTRAGMRVGTAGFMSPEQAEGELDQLGPATDVYALGATLYPLLTGRGAFEDPNVGARLEKTLTGDFPAPRSVNPRVPRALEAICLRAMATRPEDRYGSVRAFADDLKRWLADEPVTARREPRAARMARWVRKHRVLSATVVAALLVASAMLAASTALLTRSNERTRRQERIALQNLNESRRVVNSMLEYLIEKLSDVDRMDATMKEVAERALAFNADFVLRRSDEPAVRHDVARALMQAGRLRTWLDRSAEAERAYLDAREILEGLAAGHPDVNDYRRTLASTLSQLGELYERTGRAAEAEPLFRRALELDERLASEPSADAGSVLREANGHFRLALFYDKGSRAEEAERHYRWAKDLQEGLAARHPEEVDFRDDLARTLYEFGYFLDLRVKSEEPLAIYERLVELRKDLARERPASAGYRNRLAGALSYLGSMYGRRGRPGASEGAHREAVAIHQELVEQHPDRTDYQVGLLKAYANLANQLRRVARPAEAEAWHRRSLEIADRAAREHPEQVDYRVTQGSLCKDVGLDELDQGNPGEALEWLDRSIALLEPVYLDSPRNRDSQIRLLDSYRQRARALYGLARYAEALADLDRVAGLTRAADPAVRDGAPLDNLLRARVLLRLGDRLDASVESLGGPGRESGGEATYEAAALTAVLAEVTPQDRDRLAARAVELLAHARDAGAFRLPSVRAGLASDRDFDGLRPREDFRAFVADLAFPDDPFAR